MEELKFVIFRLDEQRYGMNLMYINGIEQDYHLIPVPNAPEGVKGLINLRGDVIPVYSLRERFNMEKEGNQAKRSLLITKSLDTLLAFEVDEVLMIVDMQENDINKMPSVASNKETEFMEQILHIKNDIIIAINVNKVLSEETRQKIVKMIDENKEN